MKAQRKVPRKSPTKIAKAAKAAAFDVGALILNGVAGTLNTVGAPMLYSDDMDTRKHGEMLDYLGREIERAVHLMVNS